MQKKILLPILLTLLFGLVACSSDTNANNEQANNNQQVNNEEAVEAIEPVSLQITDFGEKAGFTMEAPLSEVETGFSLQGSVEKATDLEEDFYGLIYMIKIIWMLLVMGSLIIMYH